MPSLAPSTAALSQPIRSTKCLSKCGGRIIWSPWRRGPLPRLRSVRSQVDQRVHIRGDGVARCWMSPSPGSWNTSRGRPFGSRKIKDRPGRVSSFVATMGSATMRLTAAMRSTACLGATAVEGFSNTQQPIESVFTQSGSSSPVSESCSADDFPQQPGEKCLEPTFRSAPAPLVQFGQRCGSASAGGRRGQPAAVEGGRDLLAAHCRVARQRPNPMPPRQSFPSPSRFP
jgi:hypothetical protein